MSVNDETRHTWLSREKRAVVAAIAARVPVLGVCLGAQIIASARGARVTPNAEKEIGWWTIEGTGSHPLFEAGRSYRVFQWHGETFELPPGAKLLASSAPEEVTNFFERRVSAYQVGVTGDVVFDADF